MKTCDAFKQINLTYCEAIHYAWMCNKVTGVAVGILSLPTLVVSGFFRMFASSGWSHETTHMDEMLDNAAAHVIENANLSFFKSMRTGFRLYNHMVSENTYSGHGFSDSNKLACNITRITSLTLIISGLLEWVLFGSGYPDESIVDTINIEPVVIDDYGSDVDSEGSELETLLVS